MTEYQPKVRNGSPKCKKSLQPEAGFSWSLSSFAQNIYYIFAACNLHLDNINHMSFQKGCFFSTLFCLYVGKSTNIQMFVVQQKNSKRVSPKNMLKLSFYFSHCFFFFFAMLSVVRDIFTCYLNRTQLEILFYK